MDNKQTFLHSLKDNLLIMKDLLNKKIEMHEKFLNNEDGRLEQLLKTAQINIMLQELKKDHSLTDEQIKEKMDEISKLTQEMREKIE